MPSIQTFNDFMVATGPSYLTSVDSVINEAVKNTYAFSRLLKGKTTEQTVQGGNEIRDVIMFDDARTYGHYQPNDTFVWSNPQVSDYIRCPWRFHIDHMSWTDAEVQLNTGETAGSTKAAYKRLKKIKEMRMWTSMLNGMEEDLWARPDVAQMEAETGRLPYSLPYFLTEVGQDFGGALGRRGTAPYTASTNTSHTVMRISPFTESRWTNALELYNCATDASAPTSTNWGTVYNPSLTSNTVYSQGAASTATVSNLFNAFDVMFMRLRYEKPQTRQQYFENDQLNRQMILTSLCEPRLRGNRRHLLLRPRHGCDLPRAQRHGDAVARWLQRNHGSRWSVLWLRHGKRREHDREGTPLLLRERQLPHARVPRAAVLQDPRSPPSPQPAVHLRAARGLLVEPVLQLPSASRRRRSDRAVVIQARAIREKGKLP
jgi:hypothetical protein